MSAREAAAASNGSTAVGENGEIGEAGALEDAAELIRPRRAGERDLGGDDAPLHQVGERLLHGEHAARGAGLHHRVDLLDLCLADEVADRVVGDQDLERGDTPTPVGSGDEVLRHDSLQRGCKLYANLALLFRGEGVDDAVDRLRRTLGVQRREDEMSRLGGRQRGADRLEVAHFADEDHVGVFAKRSAQRLAERRRVGAELALVDDAGAVPVEKLDRVLDREDVLVPRAVHVVEQRGQRGRLAGTGRAGDQDKTARLLRELVQPGGHVELFERLDARRNEPERGGQALALEEGVDAESRQTRDGVREVDLAPSLEMLLLLGRDDAVEQRARLLRGKLVVFDKPFELAVDPNDRRGARSHVEVRRITLDHDGEQFVDRVEGFGHGFLLGLGE